MLSFVQRCRERKIRDRNRESWMLDYVWGEWGRGKWLRTSLTTGTSLTTCKSFSKVNAVAYIIYKATDVQTFEIHYEISQVRALVYIREEATIRWLLWIADLLDHLFDHLTGLHPWGRGCHFIRAHEGWLLALHHHLLLLRHLCVCERGSEWVSE